MSATRGLAKLRAEFPQFTWGFNWMWFTGKLGDIELKITTSKTFESMWKLKVWNECRVVLSTDGDSPTAAVSRGLAQLELASKAHTAITAATGEGE